MQDDEDYFHDTRDDLSSLTEGASCSSIVSSFSDGRGISDSPFLRCDFWTRDLQSVHERRLNFIRWMGLDSSDDKSMMVEELSDPSPDASAMPVDRITGSSGPLPTTSGVAEGLPSNQFMMDSLSKEASSSLEIGAVVQNFSCMIKNLDDGTQYTADERGEDGTLTRMRVVGSDQFIAMEEFQRNIGPSPLDQRLLHRDFENARSLAIARKKVKRNWLGKLSSVACAVDNHVKAHVNDKLFDSIDGTGTQKVRVHSYKKQFKELSFLYSEHEFQAHGGAILTMKFSLDGRYLASGGEDGIVRVWKVVEDEISSELDILVNDPSCIYFKLNNFSCLAPLDVDKEKLGEKEKFRRSSDSTCVILPPKTFRILERTLHEFHGHSGDILDLSWSKRRFLLSSSVDKTVRLWQVGTNICLRVYIHNNYVTCVNFNPVNDNFFISGSIDGKVRIWEVLRCQVIDYIDIKEIVTAVCYRPDGKGTVVGTMTGHCNFYDIIDDHLQLDAQLCLQGKKKARGKRITGLQFSPRDTGKLLVASADSLICIVCGVNVICKFKGLRSAESQMLASFTSDGKHIISVSDDSNVCIWNYTGQDRTYSKVKRIWSSESFLSPNAAIAIPWGGIESMPEKLLSAALRGDFNQGMSLSSPDCFSLSRGFLSELMPKVSATWPEETLLDSSPMFVSPPMCKSEYKFLKSACKGISNSHLWGQVIVTGGWDGQIRVYHNYGLPVRH